MPLLDKKSNIRVSEPKHPRPKRRSFLGNLRDEQATLSNFEKSITDLEKEYEDEKGRLSRLDEIRNRQSDIQDDVQGKIDGNILPRISAALTQVNKLKNASIQSIRTKATSLGNALGNLETQVKSLRKNLMDEYSALQSESQRLS